MLRHEWGVRWAGIASDERVKRTQKEGQSSLDIYLVCVEDRKPVLKMQKARQNHYLTLRIDSSYSAFFVITVCVKSASLCRPGKQHLGQETVLRGCPVIGVSHWVINTLVGGCSLKVCVNWTRALVHFRLLCFRFHWRKAASPSRQELPLPVWVAV